MLKNAKRASLTDSLLNYHTILRNNVYTLNDLRSKINNIDSSLKYIMKDWNIEILKKDIKDMKFDIEKKNNER
jgi:hypothetical protein